VIFVRAGLAKNWTTGLASPFSWAIPVTWPNHRGWDLSIQRSVSRFRAFRISQLYTLLRSVSPWTLDKNPISVLYTSNRSLLMYPRFITMVLFVYISICLQWRVTYCCHERFCITKLMMFFRKVDFASIELYCDC